jgi:mercuric reductase
MVPKAHIIGDTRGLVKMVADAKTKRVVGVHILASNAADIIHEGVLAVKFKLTIDDIIDTVHVFPTLSESLKLAAQSFYRDVRMMSCCTE